MVAVPGRPFAAWLVDCFGLPRMERTVELVLGFASVGMSIGMLAAIPWLVRRLPSDHFVRPHGGKPLWKSLLQNLVGVSVVAVGILLLVLPGQGVLTILIGLSILDLPIKHRVVAWLLRRPAIRDTLQKLRERMKQPPLLFPDTSPRDRARPSSPPTCERGGPSEGNLPS